MSNRRTAAPCGKVNLPASALCIALVSLYSPAAQAARLDYVIDASVSHSDNIGLEETDERNETVVSPQVMFNLEQTGATLQLNARGSIRYLHYMDDTFDDDTRGELAGSLKWIVFPERMDFIVEDVLSEQPTNTLVGFSPGNQQQVNVFTAGPTFHARFGAATNGELDLHYVNTHANETENFNGDRLNLAGRVIHRLNATDAISGHVEVSKVDYDLGGDLSDYTRSDIYANYTSELSSIRLDLSGGYSRIDPRDSGENTTSPLVRANVDWMVDPRNTLTFRSSYEFSDATRALVERLGDGAGPVVTDPTDINQQVGPEIYRQRRFEAGYEFTGERLGVTVRPYYERVRYLEGPLSDQDNKGTLLNVSFRLKPQLLLSLSASKEQRDFEDSDRRDKDTYFNLELSRQFSRRWSARINLLRRERDSTNPGSSYTENVATLTVAFNR
jgi:hypothetical protein